MKYSLTLTPIQTRIFRQGEALLDFILQEVPSEMWQEDTLLAISSKIVSLAENRLIKKNQISKKDLIRQEAEHYLGEFSEHKMSLTIHHHLLMPAAGIDESNSETGDYILLPENPLQSASLLLEQLKLATKLKNLGLIFTDSKSNPLRHGTVGVSLAYAGFKPVHNKIGDKDLFARTLKITKINVVDSLAAAAVLTMGEADESTPLCMLHGASVTYTDQLQPDDLFVSIEEDLYKDLYFSRLQTPDSTDQ